ncbi:hypothetical protein AY599_19210 [Leptolyngbya valderiana BDU 20041]|nr:Uma2 family endonuclease [Geitlerinema sp. CS-897]OAB60884.1 hypothetical protein AY599_19210 [Leptolyngbya valderiana BDU 20041]PPT06379.1 Protein of unknown function DUF820 [Geitlerinema sp. FC II]
MVSPTEPQTKTPTKPIIYPDSDGKPMADNTLQFRWIVTIKENLELIFADNPEVFVAGDLLWYPVEGNNKLRVAPDVMVAFGRPKGERGSYKQWCENDIAPQVVFEILSPGNTLKEMTRKEHFYDNFGVEEYYIYDPDKNEFMGLIRGESRLEIIEDLDGWTSPRLGIRFELGEDELTLYRPDGSEFESLQQIQVRLNAVQAERDAVQAKADRLAEKLRELGVDPDEL